MKVLVVKLSSLGDIVHTLPALTDASSAYPAIRFDWAVEEDFAEIPAWHPAVERVIPVALRRWRRHPLRYFRSPQWRDAKAQLRQVHYDALIDAQGLMKSAFVARLVPTTRYGMDWRSVRERLASSVYHHGIRVPREMHAVQRTRTLFARALKYALPSGAAQYGLDDRFTQRSEQGDPYLLFFHGSAVARKLWPERRWIELTQLATAAGLRVLLPWGSDQERDRAQHIASSAGAGVQVLPRLNLTALADLAASASGMVAVDTGLGHLGAALGTPGVSLYGHTQPELVGTLGRHQVHLRHAAEISALSAQSVWAQLLPVLRESDQPGHAREA